MEETNVTPSLNHAHKQPQVLDSRQYPFMGACQSSRVRIPTIYLESSIMLLFYYLLLLITILCYT